VVILVAWVAAGVIAILVATIVGYDAISHVKRLNKAIQTARDDVLPKVRELVPPASTGRHRAPTGK
jgi:hypothetical protein